MKKNAVIHLYKIISEAFCKIMRKVPLKDGLYEFVDSSDICKYSKYIWEILQESSKPLGGFKGYNSIGEMCSRVSLVVVAVAKNKIVACAVYRDDFDGRKLIGCGTLNGYDYQKELLRSIIKDDIDNLHKIHWMEVSCPLEKWLMESDGKPIPSGIAYKLLHEAKSKLIILEDGVHYQRKTEQNNMMVTKAIYAFEDKIVFQHVAECLEKYSGFKAYCDSSKDKENIAAREMIVLISNAWDDGFRELTPRMKTYLKNAISILGNNEDNQVLSLIRNGEYLLQNMDVLEYHDYCNCILIPAF